MCPDICSVKLDKWQVDRNPERLLGLLNRKSSSQWNVTTSPTPGSCYSSLYFNWGWGLSVSAASSKWLQFPAENRTSSFEAILPGCSPDTAPQPPFSLFFCSPVRKFAIIRKKSILTLHSPELSGLFANTRSMALEMFFLPEKEKKLPLVNQSSWA